MQTEAIFENIAERIQQEIKRAKSSIYIAVAWFTNQTIFDEIVKKAKDGCSVLLMISNDEINSNSSINYAQLNIGKSKVYKIGDGKKELLHHKFCVIDHNIVITGSYNWSYKAENNFENIIVTSEDSSLAQQFIKEFDELQNQYYPNDKEVVSDFPLNKIIKRLEILKNYIMLEDVDDVNSESSKLIQYDFNSDLKNIIESIKNGELADAINNTTLGLLVVLVIIAALNQFGSFTEGFKLNKELKKGEKEQHSILSKGHSDLTKEESDLSKREEHDVKHKLKKISNLKKEQETTGVNLQDLRNTTMPKDSNTIQVDKNMISSEEVSPSTSSMLNSSLKENFSILNKDY